MADGSPTRSDAPTFREALRRRDAAAPGLGEVKPGEAPSGHALLGAVGGIRGLIEAILPGLVFLSSTRSRTSCWLSVLAPFAIAVVFIVVRADPAPAGHAGDHGRDRHRARPRASRC